jgi:predicted O-methyltransferase YrrM
MSSTKTLSSGHLTSLASLSSSSFDSSNVNVIASDGRNNFKSSVSSSIITRDPRNGAFTFQVHAEYDMLLRVQKDLDKHRRSSRGPREGGSGSNYGTNSNNTTDDDDDASADEESIRLSRRIMLSIDNYCLHEQWMYHIGHEKGEALSRFLTSCLEKWSGSNNSGNHDGKEVRKFVCVELGTYCGYSALVLAITLRRFLLDQKQHEKSISSSSPFEFHIYTTDISTKLLNVARSIFRLAGMEGCITPILVQQQDCVVDDHHEKNENSVNVPDDANTQDLGGYLRRGGGVGVSNNQYRGTYDDQGQEKVVLRKDDVPHTSSSSSASIQPLSTILQEQYSINQIDFLLFDHAKHLYLHDLICLEQSKLVRKGTHVCADNVLYNRLDEYRSHMLELEQLKVVDDENGSGGAGCGVVETRLEEMNLEYTNNLKDGMGEFLEVYNLSFYD